MISKLRFVRQVCALSAALTFASVSLAQSRPTALDIVPQGAAFYWASMNHKAQYDALVNSNAYQRLMETTIAKDMRRAYRSGRRRGFEQFGYDNPFALYLQGYSESIGSMSGKWAMTFLKEIFGNEVFIYADQDWNVVSDAVSQAYLRIMNEVLAAGDLQDFNEQDLARLLPVLRAELQDINTPTIVIGTVLDEPAAIETLLKMAEEVIEELFDQLPPNLDYVADAFEVIEEDDAYLLSLSLKSESIPWDAMKGDPFFQDHGDDVKALLAGKSISVTFGTKGQYLLFSVGPTAEHVVSLGSGPLLIDAPKMKPLKEAADQPLIGVTYVSETTMQRSRDLGGLIDYLVYGLQFAVQTDDEIAGTQELIRAIQTDATELKADLAQLVPKSGTYVSFSYLNDQGIAGSTYDWSENKSLDSSKPLSILQLVGSQPALVLAGREQGSVKQYNVVSKWCGKFFDHVERFAPRFIENEHQAAMFRDVMMDLRPIVQKIDDATRDDFLPATANGEFALVLDFSSKKRAWHAAMPESDQPVPLPALAAVMEIHDSNQIKRAGDAYLDGAKELLELIRAIPDAEIPPEFQIAPPQVRTFGNAEMFYYEIPAEMGLDKTLVPHAVLDSDWLVFSYSTEQSARIMNRTSPLAYAGPLSNSQRPIMSAVYYDNHELIDALRDWLAYGIEIAAANGATIDMKNNLDAENDLLLFSESDLMESLDRIFDLVKCFQRFEAAGYMKDGARVSEFQMFFKDVDD